MDLLLGIDLGSTSIKAAAFDPKGGMAHIASRENRSKSMDPDNPTWLSWDPDEVWEKTLECIAECARQTASIGHIRALAVTGMGMDGVPVDRDGNWLYPFISWQCKRTEAVKSQWSQKLGERRIFDITGKQVMSIDTLYRILWVKQNLPEIYQRAHKWLLIEDYVNMKLCGAMATDHSMASCTSIMDQRTGDWSDEIIGACELRRDMLPPILQSGTALGAIFPDVARATGLPGDAIVALGGHDYSCAAVASGVIDPGKVFDVTGTWEMLFAPTDAINLSAELFEQGFKSESHAARGRYAIFADVVSSYMMEWARTNLAAREPGAEPLSWEAIVEMTERAPAFSGGVFFLPTLMGRGCPAIDEKALAAFVGMNPSTDFGTLCRAVMEGLNYQFRDMLLAHEKATGCKVTEIIATGGATRNRFLMQNKADICGATLLVAENAESTALGAAMLAGIGCGLYADEREAYGAIRQNFVRYEPGELAAQYQRYYEQVYLRLHDALKGLNAFLHAEFHQPRQSE